ncbi:iron-sulfur cluster assembly scaffold protein [Altererythrobacter indicus]|uniref:Iron-sulfur cluster assembly scaffold protein n=1 Tax=Altericroceibacterium indicum TaxID=374177 RepID=A0A845A764_9SPHN|nr:iron-sulfur cluster assembly scaffold protein [Altericroceibacterium indicum]MXP25199.1 iron-sulfur cluster assembly scaffold protein [Altericroceibacterium indicum]
MAATEKLYSPHLLALAVELAQYPANPALSLFGKAKSPTCGSVMSLYLETDNDGRICDIGLKTQACAVGQAATAIFARHAKGKNVRDIDDMISALDSWLNDAGPIPEWSDLGIIAAAKDFPGRHGAIRLPWQAAYRALHSII